MTEYIFLSFTNIYGQVSSAHAGFPQGVLGSGFRFYMPGTLLNGRQILHQMLHQHPHVPPSANISLNHLSLLSILRACRGGKYLKWLHYAECTISITCTALRNRQFLEALVLFPEHPGCSRPCTLWFLGCLLPSCLFRKLSCLRKASRINKYDSDGSITGMFVSWKKQ